MYFLFYCLRVDSCSGFRANLLVLFTFWCPHRCLPFLGLPTALFLFYFCFTTQELATCIQYNLNVVHVILNDNAFGMIKWKQAGAGFENWGLDLQNPDLVALAESYGCKGYRVTKADELVPLLTQCLNEPGTHVVEVPFSYQWVSQHLETIPAQVQELHQIIAQEFGLLHKEDCFHGSTSTVSDTKESEDKGDKQAMEAVSVTAPKVTATPSMTKPDVPTAPVPPASVPAPVAPPKQSRVAGQADYSVQPGSTLPFYLAVRTKPKTKMTGNFGISSKQARLLLVLMMHRANQLHPTAIFQS